MTDTTDDILVGCVYVQADNRSAAHRIMSEWSRTDLDYADRVDHLFSCGGLNEAFVLNATTVFDDNAKDKLRGKKGFDWFLANDDDDKSDLASHELLMDIELDFVNGD